jgi:FkbM family methyltransferase
VIKKLLKSVATLLPPSAQQAIREAYLTRRVLTSREFHEPEVGMLHTFVSAGDVVVDIGANVGAYTKEMSTIVGEAGRVHSFEPVGANFKILENVVRKGRFANVRTYRAALGSRSEEREIVIPDLGGFTGYYWAHFVQPGETGKKVEKVKVLKLDEMYERGEMPRLDFIKCDVEGAELEVLNGCASVLRGLHPAWLLEVSKQTSDAVFALFRASGYSSYVYGNKLVPTDRYLDGRYSNYFFFHPESSAWRRLGLGS